MIQFSMISLDTMLTYIFEILSNEGTVELLPEISTHS